MNKKTYTILGIVIVIIVIIFIAIGLSAKPAQAPAITTTTTTATSTIASTSSATSGVSMSVSSTNASSSLIVSTSTETAYTGPAFSFVYPKPWAYTPSVDFSIDTFGGQWINNDIIPPGGAAVDVVTTTISGPVSDIVNTEIMGAFNIATSTIVVDKISCEKATAQSNYAPGYTSNDIDVYCARGDNLWKIYLSYNSNDPAGSKHVSDFNGMLTSMKFLP
jgi:hypothetical protein